MGICPNCGSWVDEGDICHGCGGSGTYSSSDDEDELYAPPVENQSDSLGREAWNLYLDNKCEDALYKINQALDFNDRHAENWNKKAIILDGLERYSESEYCYNRALNLYPHKLVYDNKAGTLRNWAGQLLCESRELSYRLPNLEEALKINEKAIDAITSGSGKNIDSFTSQKRIIESEIKHEKEYQKNVEILKAYDKKELFTITGMQYYKINMPLTQGMSLKLVKEPDNKFDKYAIAVYVHDKKAGYVANSDSTKFELTSSASELQDKIQDIAHGEILMYLFRTTNPDFYDIQLFIGRIIR